MVKAADKTMVIENIRVMEKKGGQSGNYVRNQRGRPVRPEDRGE
jgi:hypothetical protein